MNQRERFLAVFNFQEVDHVVDVEFGAWEETFPVWHKQGLPKHVTNNEEFGKYFGFEDRHHVPVDVVGFRPGFEREVIEEDEETITYRDSKGIVQREFKHRSSIPQFLSYPVKTREDWKQKIEWRFDISDEAIEQRYPANWEELKKEWKNRDYPLGISCGGFYGWIRDLMGVEDASIAFATEPEFIEEMIERRTELACKAIRRAAGEVDLDFSSWWEDMCYNRAPLISPAMFERFLVPAYRRIVDILEENGVHIHIMDSDGKIDELVSLWLDAGINCMFPIEAAWTDPLELREIYGRRVLLLGGVNKHALISGVDAVKQELKRLEPCVKEGGFIPHVDHRVPPDVKYNTYLRYLEIKRKMIGM